ncbi:hypothetical protein [Salinithrix halophila]|uniref:hypothetical protein n=1 Tax=Salinithrix halophila TaxID=1485204 RepID=UPI0036D26299
MQVFRLHPAFALHPEGMLGGGFDFFSTGVDFVEGVDVAAVEAGVGLLPFFCLCRRIGRRAIAISIKSPIT